MKNTRKNASFSITKNAKTNTHKTFARILRGAGALILVLCCYLSASVAFANGIPSHDKVILSKVDAKIDCSQCHPATVTAASEVFDIVKVHGGDNVQCSICHESTNMTIIDAVNSGGAVCGDCHPDHVGANLGHTARAVVSQHDTADVLSQLSIQCDQCHEGAHNLTTVHKDCATCHGFDVPEPVKVAVQSGSRSCDNIGCHAGVHTNTTEKHDTSDVLQSQVLECVQCHEGASNLTSTHKDCKVCHSDTVSEDVKSAVKLKNRSCDACHGVVHADVKAIHASSYPAVTGLDCTSCHGALSALSSSSLHKNCSVCHSANVSDKVKAAVSTGDTKCVTCHGAIHTNVASAHAKFVPGFDLDCQTCHGNGSGLIDPALHSDCATCHGVHTSETVKTAVASGDTTCTSCHVDFHTELNVSHIAGFPKVEGLECFDCHPSTNAVSDQRLHSSCNMCHGVNASTTVKNAVLTGKTSCTACHGPIHAEVSDLHALSYPPQSGIDCAQCHGDVKAISDAKLHASCALCHASTASAKVKAAVAAGDTNCSTCHGEIHPSVDSAHEANFAGEQELGCSSCHSTSLSSASLHSSCGFCHDANASETVKQAVSEGKTACSACHGATHTNLMSAHASPEKYQQVCGPCHGNSLIGTGSGNKGLGVAHTCQACHASTDLNVITAIKAGKASCTSCHPDHHQMGKLTGGGGFRGGRHR